MIAQSPTLFNYILVVKKPAPGTLYVAQEHFPPQLVPETLIESDTIALVSLSSGRDIAATLNAFPHAILYYCYPSGYAHEVHPHFCAECGEWAEHEDPATREWPHAHRCACILEHEFLCPSCREAYRIARRHRFR